MAGLAGRGSGDYDKLKTVGASISSDTIIVDMGFAAINPNLKASDLKYVYVDLDDDSRVTFEFITEEKTISGVLVYETTRYRFLKDDVVMNLGLDIIYPTFTEYDPVSVMTDVAKAGNWVFVMKEVVEEVRS